ncbi:Protein SRC2 homolog [Linum grandiflorum]
MECRRIDITIQSAKDLKDVNLFSKMDVFAAVSINGCDHRLKPKQQKQRTPIDKDCGPNPWWGHRVSFTVDEPSLQQNRITVKFELVSARNLGDREIGGVNVPVKELFGKGDDGGGAERTATYAVRTPSGRSKGTLTFSYKFGEKFSSPAASADHKGLSNLKSDPSPTVAYPPPPAGYPPVGSSTGSGYPYKPPSTPPAAVATAYPAPPPAGYPPPQQGYGVYPGYPPQPAYGGYYNHAPPPPAGYPPYQPGYGAYPGYPPQPVYGGGGYQRPHKSGGSGGKMALGVGAGLLGGLLVGDMISDVGEMAAYDSGYGAGFDDGFDF